MSSNGYIRIFKKKTYFITFCHNFCDIQQKVHMSS
jgi:hypothetical protein